MKSTIIKPILLIWLICFTFNGLAKQKNEQLNLQACIDYALENAFSVKSAEIEYLKAKKKSNEILGIGLPQIKLDAGFTDNLIIPNTFLPARALAIFRGEDPNTIPENTPDIPITFGTRFMPNVVFKLSQLVIDPRYFIGLEAVEKLVDYSKQQIAKSKEDLIYDITKAYYTILINQERVKIFASNLARLDTLIRQTQVLLENGYALSIDVNRLKVSYNNLKTQQKQLENALVISKNALKLQMGKPIEIQIELTEVIDTANILKIQLPSPDFHFNRMDYNLLKTQRELNKYDIRQVRSGYLPSLYLDIGYGYNSGSQNFDNILPLRNFSFWKLRFSVPIMDGFQRHNKIKQLRLDDKKIELADEFMKKQIRFEQEQTILNFQNALLDIKSQKENIALAKDIYDISVVNYQEGVGSSSDVVTTQTSYKEAQSNYFTSILNLLITKLDYDKAFGNIENSE